MHNQISRFNTLHDDGRTDGQPCDGKGGTRRQAANWGLSPERDRRGQNFSPLKHTAMETVDCKKRDNKLW